MKVARIEKTGKQAVTLFLITGICLLANKGIVPIGLIALLLLTGGLMDLLFSLLFLVVKIWLCSGCFFINIQSMQVWKRSDSPRRLRPLRLSGPKMTAADRSKDVFHVQWMNPKASAITWKDCAASPAVRTGKPF